METVDSINHGENSAGKLRWKTVSLGMSVPLYLCLLQRQKQGITYQGFSPSPHASLWLIASCHPSSYNPPRLKDNEDVRKWNQSSGKAAKIKAGSRKPIKKGKHWDLLCLPAWVLLMLAAKCEGDAYPLMCVFFSVLDGAGIIMTKEKRAHTALSGEVMTSEAQQWPAVSLCCQQRETSLRLRVGQLWVIRIVLQNAK